ncbi:neutral zinc metallopeptidase [Nakamurella endophytica]|uniref:Metalloprotease n=1 Tax=Nakamurella endophytica TaxID=1748367 RepID=A0A917SQL3_9ACTN|nr:neutral zinc metallopeptidase [Nakamurella endophytica]GGL93867.1 hypothetical protein GCM10011594_12130 [Nakamurella endophytica]
MPHRASVAAGPGSGRRASWPVAAVAAVAVAVAAITATVAVVHPASQVGGTPVVLAGPPVVPASGPPATDSLGPTAAPPGPSTSTAVPVTAGTAATRPAAATPPARTSTRTVTVTERPGASAGPTGAPSTRRPSTRPAAPPSTTAPQSTAPGTTRTRSTLGLSGDAAVYRDADTAVTAVEAYWDDVFTGWDVTWIGPTVWQGDGFYDSASAVPGPSCHGRPAPEMNASFCGDGVPGDGVVSWDLQLLRAGHRAFGDPFVYLVVAHEWGHAAQERFVADGEAPAVLAQQELQADCLAGATLARAADDGRLTLRAGDTERLLGSLNAMGDSHSGAGTGDHGSSAQREAWFGKGFDGDIESCLGHR